MTGDRKVLAERVPDEAVVGEQAAQVVVTLEEDAVQVEGLPLKPAGRIPDLGHAGHQGLVVVGTEGAQSQAPVVRHRQQVQHHGKARAFVGAFAIAAVVHTTKVHHLLKAQRGFVP